MASNVSGPFGFTQRSGTGSAPTYEQVGYRNGGIAYNAAAIYFGDPVVPTSTSAGTLVQAAGAAGASTLTMAGIFYGCKYLSTAQKRVIWSNYWPGSDVVVGAQSSIEAYVCNDPNAQFLCQSDSTGVTQTDVGANFDFNIGTGNAANGLSGAYLLHTGVVTAAYPFRLVALVLEPPGAPGTASGAYNYAVVAFNNVQTKVTLAYNA
jgi:hypothetical protein